MSKTQFPSQEEIDASVTANKIILERVKNSMNTNKMMDIPGGSHCTPDNGILTLAALFKLKKGDNVWDIGVGVALMAFFFSHITHRATIGNDIGKYTYIDCNFIVSNIYRLSLLIIDPDVISYYKGKAEGQRDVSSYYPVTKK